MTANDEPPKLPRAIVDKLSGDEVEQLIDWFFAMVKWQEPQTTSDLYERVGQMLTHKRSNLM